MDPNHSPSSPLPHHRHSSSHADQPPPDRTTTAESNKLNLPPTYSPGTSGPSETQLPSFSAQWEAPNQINSPLSDAYESHPWQTQAVAGPSSIPYIDPALSPPEISSALTTPSMPTEPALLTSEPLNRSTSTAGSPIIPFPPDSMASSPPHPPVTGKRDRAQSLPPLSPDLKRIKYRHDPQTPSQPWKWYYRDTTRQSRDKYKSQRAQEAAEGLRRELEAGRTRQPTSVIVASRQPPINTSTLKSLDANEILKNPQLRHDLLFDALAFRPVSTITMTHSAPEVGSARDPALDPRAACAVADMYWDSIHEEITKGCRCARWRVNGLEGKIDMASLLAKKREPGCCCGAWRQDLPEGAWWDWQDRRWQSRLPDMIKTLREILLSLMGSTTPCSNHFAHSFSPEALTAHETSCPTVTHALVPELYKMLDPEFITIRIRRQAFGLDIFRMLGEAMKVHCAPVRDAMVDDMVETATMGNVALGLRKAFDCVEVMKLDIANHQVHALRPYLWRSAASHELAAFRATLFTSGMTLENSTTRRWMRAASTRLIKTLPPSKRPCLVESRGHFVFKSVVEGFIDLVCSNWTDIPSTWPPMPQRRVGNSAASIQLVEMSPLTNVNVPETLRFDIRRIKGFNADMIDLAITHMILGEFVKGYKVHNPASTFGQIKEAAAVAKDDIDSAFVSPGVYQTFINGDQTSDLAIRLATRIVRTGRLFADKPAIVSRDDILKIESIGRAFDAILSTQIRLDSAMFIAAMKQIRIGIEKSLTHHLACVPPAGTAEPDCSMVERELAIVTGIAPISTIESGPAGRRAEYQTLVARLEEHNDRVIKVNKLDHVYDDIRSLCGKMSKIISFNLNVFIDTYMEKGMIIGA